MSKKPNPYPSDVSDEEWEFCAPYSTLMKLEALSTPVRRDMGGSAVLARFQFANRRKDSLILLFRMGRHFGIEIFKDLPQHEQSWFVCAVDGSHLARQEIQAGKFFLQIGVMRLLDVIAQFGQCHCIGVALETIWGSIYSGQHGDDRFGIERSGLAKIRALAGMARTISPM